MVGPDRSSSTTPFPPYDGTIAEQKYALLAQGLANTILVNVEAMHQVGGVLVSTWTPGQGPGGRVATSDLALTSVALAKYAKYLDLEPEGRRRATELVRRQADFLLRVAAADGSYRDGYRLPEETVSGRRNMTSQAFAIRALLAAYELTGDARVWGCPHGEGS